MLTLLIIVDFSPLKRKSELVDLAENIQQKLSYFNELETINTVSMFFTVCKVSDFIL